MLTISLERWIQVPHGKNPFEGISHEKMEGAPTFGDVPSGGVPREMGTDPPGRDPFGGILPWRGEKRSPFADVPMGEVDSGPRLGTFPWEKWAGPSLEEFPLRGVPGRGSQGSPLEEMEGGPHLEIFPLERGVWIPLEEIPISGIPYLERWPKDSPWSGGRRSPFGGVPMGEVDKCPPGGRSPLGVSPRRGGCGSPRERGPPLWKQEGGPQWGGRCGRGGCGSPREKGPPWGTGRGPHCGASPGAGGVPVRVRGSGTCSPEPGGPGGGDPAAGGAERRQQRPGGRGAPPQEQ